MPSTSEKGHAKNVDNFSTLIEVCKGFGVKYNPSKTAIKVANLTTKLTQSKQQLQDVKDKEQAESTARNNRADAFKNKGTFSTKLLSAIKATDATDQTIADATSINKKIQGERLTAGKKATPVAQGTTTTDPKTISTSQLSYTNIVDHYKKYKTLLTSIATIYTPNETELQTAAVSTYITNLETLNNTVDIAATAASNALIARDNGIYADKTGIPDLAQDVKDCLVLK